MFVFTLFCDIHDFITLDGLWFLLYTILYCENLILEGGGLQLPKIGGGQRKTGADRLEKRGWWFGSGYLPSKRQYPPPPHTFRVKRSNRQIYDGVGNVMEKMYRRYLSFFVAHMKNPLIRL